MLDRALSLATVTLLIGCLTAIPVRAQNLEAGKSPSQIFAGTCAACHKSPRGLLKSVPAGSLPGYLRQHYTTSSEMASLLSAFLISNGAADTRYVGTKPTQQPKDARPPTPEQLDRQGRPIRPAAPLQEAARPSEAQPAAKPDADGIVRQAEPGARHGRNARRAPRPPGEVPEPGKPAVEGQVPAQAAGESGPDGRKSGAKQKLSKRGKPGNEESAKESPKAGTAGAAEPAKGETAKDDAAKSDTPKSDTPKIDTSKSEIAKDDAGKPEGAKPSEAGKSEAAKVDAPKETGGETPALRADPVPPVTPAPPAAAASTAAVPGAPTAAANGASEPAASPSVPAPAPPPAVEASVPPPAPVAPAGPPVPPISH